MPLSLFHKEEPIKYGSYENDETQYATRTSDLKLNPCDEVMPQPQQRSSFQDSDPNNSGMNSRRNSVMRRAMRTKTKTAISICMACGVLIVIGVFLVVYNLLDEEPNDTYTIMAIILVALSLSGIMITCYYTDCFYSKEKQAINRREEMMSVFQQYDNTKKLSVAQEQNIRKSQQKYGGLAGELDR